MRAGYKPGYLPSESFFRGWRIDHDLTGRWKAECPDWGKTVEARTLRALIVRMRKAEEWAREYL